MGLRYADVLQQLLLAAGGAEREIHIGKSILTSFKPGMRHKGFRTTGLQGDQSDLQISNDGL